jgi:hypothetical protein
MMDERQDHGGGEYFRWTELRAVEGFDPLDGDCLPSLFLIQLKSEAEEVQQLVVDPLGFFADKIPEILNAADGGDRAQGHELTGSEREEIRSSVLRVNAHRSANPVHRAEVWAAFKDSPTLAGLQYKFQK